MVSITKVVLKLISDAGKYLFCEKGIRCGICYISKRYSKPNSKYSKCYDPKQKSKHIIQIEANNFHVYPMSKSLSTGRFKWIYPTEFDISKFTCISSNGYVLEVGLEYPKELRE